MSEIHESISVDVPFERVPELAERFLATIKNNDGDAVIPLSVEVGDLVVEREARLAIVPTRRYWGYEIMDIGWEARGGGPYPAFKGTLCAEQETLKTCRLDLDGEYLPPGNIAGAAFDAMMGHRIAQAVSRRLLERMRAAFEGTLVG
jgi:hypothetical protein